MQKEAKSVIQQTSWTSKESSTNIGVRNKLLNDAVLTGVYRQGYKGLKYFFTLMYGCLNTRFAKLRRINFCT
jgi:hypothetical protein